MGPASLWVGFDTMLGGTVIEITRGSLGLGGARVKKRAEKNRTLQNFTRPENRAVGENRGVQKRAVEGQMLDGPWSILSAGGGRNESEGLAEGSGF